MIFLRPSILRRVVDQIASTRHQLLDARADLEVARARVALLEVRLERLTSHHNQLKEAPNESRGT